MIIRHKRHHGIRCDAGEESTNYYLGIPCDGDAEQFLGRIGVQALWKQDWEPVEQPKTWRDVTGVCSADRYDIKHAGKILGEWRAAADGYELRKVRAAIIPDDLESCLRKGAVLPIDPQAIGWAFIVEKTEP